jgi:hypothetical protein
MVRSQRHNAIAICLNLKQAALHGLPLLAAAPGMAASMARKFAAYC